MLNVKLWQGFKKSVAFLAIIAQYLFGSFFSYLFYFFLTDGFVFASKKSVFYCVSISCLLFGLSIFGIRCCEISGLISQSLVFYNIVCFGVALIELIALYSNKIISQKQRAMLAYLMLCFTIFIVTNSFINAANKLNASFSTIMLLYIFFVVLISSILLILLKLLSKFIKNNFKVGSVKKIRYGLLYWLILLSLTHVVFFPQFAKSIN